MSYTYDKTGGFWKRPSYGAFAYSDGDTVERRMLSLVSSTKDRSVLSSELAEKIYDWPTRYHFHPGRANLLRPHEPLLRNATVLELGGGCGALTRYLGETCRKVTMVEGSPRRCAIASARCQGLRPISIYCEKILEADLPEASFDVVTLIGVLEYARVYDTVNADPVQAMLTKARSWLAPGGALILALENQLGLKYFAGAPEDHYNVPMLGINDVYSNDGIVTFGVHEMTQRLHKAGFASLQQYMPFPDYKLPALVIHPEARNLSPEEFNLGTLLGECVQTYIHPQNTFSLEKSWDAVSRNGLAWDLCNSLCFVARAEEASTPATLGNAPGGKVIASYYNTDRKLHFTKQVCFIKRENSITVQRTPLTAYEGTSEEKLKNQYPQEEPYYPYKKYIDALHTIVNRKDWTVAQLAEWNMPLLRYWEKQAAMRDGKATLPSAMMDCIARNVLIQDDGSFLPIDQEWSYGEETIPVSFLTFYNLLISFHNILDVEPPAAGTPLGIWSLSLAVVEALGLDFPAQEQEAFFAWLQRFHADAVGSLTTESYKTAMLAPRHTAVEMLAYVRGQTQHIHNLQGQIDNLTKERDMLARVLDKYTGKKG